MWIVEIYTGTTKKIPEYVLASLVQKFPGSTFWAVNGPYGIYWKGQVPEEERESLRHFLNRNRLRKQQWYDEAWDRDTHYRDQFLKNHTGELRCRYCNRRLTKRTLEVDHLIPVAQVKKNGRARRRLLRQGIQNVNDIRNLVPSCKRCNRRKGAKMGVWYLRGKLGKYPIYWKTLFVGKGAAVIAILSVGLYFVLK